MTKDYSKIKIPELTKKEIYRLAQEFRRTYWPDKPSPLKILEIVEFDLGMQIIPIPGLEAICSASAFITSDWKSICIDKKQYEDPSYDKRTNFSVAHEVSHFILHKEFYNGLKIEDLRDLYDFVESCPQSEYLKLEKQAMSFAAALLMPLDELERELSILVQKAKSGIIAYDQIIKKLSEKFGVSEGALKNRIAFDSSVSKDILSSLADT